MKNISSYDLVKIVVQWMENNGYDYDETDLASLENMINDFLKNGV